MFRMPIKIDVIRTENPSRMVGELGSFFFDDVEGVDLLRYLPILMSTTQRYCANLFSPQDQRASKVISKRQLPRIMRRCNGDDIVELRFQFSLGSLHSNLSQHKLDMTAKILDHDSLPLIQNMRKDYITIAAFE